MSDFSFRNWQTFPSSTPPIISPPVGGPPGPEGPPGPPTPGPTGPPGPPGAGVVSRSIEIDFGSVPVEEKSFIVIDPEITPASRITGNVAYIAPTLKSLDEISADDLSVKFSSGNGQFNIFARSLSGSVSGRFILHYFISES